MPRVHHVKKARKPRPDWGIEKGDSYYWWKFRYGGKRFSKTFPRRSQLTQSPFLGTLYDIQDSLGDLDAGPEMEGQVEDIVSQLEDLKQECEDSLENMPEETRDSSWSGELLQERIYGIDDWVSELQSMDYSAPEEGEDVEQYWEDKKQQIIDTDPGIG